VLSQIGIRKQNPDYPLSTGALEAELEKVKARLRQRIGPMAAEAAGPPTVASYTAALRRHFQGRGGVAPSDWAARRDQAGARSTDDFLAASEARAKAAIATRNTSHKAVRADRQLRERNAARAAVGLPPVVPGKRRRSVPDVYVPTGGRKVADDAELMAEWDTEKNAEAGLDPVKLGLASGKVAHWRCANGHTWTAPIIRRGTKRTSCRYCMNRAVAPENSLAALYPDVAADWHPTLNELTAEQVTPGSYRLVYWQCRKGLGHPDYRMRPVTRTAQGQGCKQCGDERVRTWQRERRDRAAEGGPGGSDPSDGEVGGLTPEDVGGDGFPF
jgi:Probable Zinc-ribbon domain